jgi:hypothetical protein
MSILHILLKGNKGYRKEVRRKVIMGTTIGARSALLLESY